MSNLGGQQVSNAVIRHVEGRAAKLLLLIEAATQNSADRKIREGGAHLAEKILENIEDLRERQAGDDIDLPDLVDVFHRRLYMAQQLVDTWNIPESVRKKLERTNKDAATKPRRRRAPAKKKAA